MENTITVMKVVLFLAFSVHQTSAATHSLQYFYTAVTPGINFPEFTVVGMVDEEQFVYYDSNIRQYVPKTEWIKKVVADNPDYWNRNTQIAQVTQETFKVNVATAMARFNQTKGVHTVQSMYGCELDDDGTKRGYMQYGYDGEDFLSLDLKRLTYVAANDKAFITKNKWDVTGAAAAQRKNYLDNICIEWLQKYVDYGRDTLERKVRPEVSVFQKDYSVVCHATGFFPKQVMISWRKDGKDLIEDVELRETLVNHDGIYQKRGILRVSPEDLKKHEYTCVVQHISLDEELVLNVADRRMLSDEDSFGIIIGVVAVAVLLLINAALIGGFFIWRKEKDGNKSDLKSPTVVQRISPEAFMVGKQYYDSNIRQYVPKTECIKKVEADDLDYWNTNTQTALGTQETNEATLMKRLNSTNSDCESESSTDSNCSNSSDTPLLKVES